MKQPEYTVFPHWKFLQETYSWEEAFSIFGPYQGANIHVRRIDKNTMETYMPQVLGNTNYVGTHFGGSLYSMCDPFFMFILIENLGPDYIVWDKAAAIEFLKPGKGTVTARFYIDDEELQTVRDIVAEKRKTDREYICEVKDEAGQVVARMRKTLYIRRNAFKKS